jgi:Cu/Ag efflux protein CusF
MRIAELIVVAAAISSTSIAACSGKRELGPADAIYQVRAQVVAQQGSGDDLRVSLSHEAIPGFKDRDGVASDMPAMTMSFAVAPNVATGPLRPGSRWQIGFEVRWNQQPTLRIVRAEPLPVGTVLKLAEH